jgi:hypothetical protein
VFQQIFHGNTRILRIEISGSTGVHQHELRMRPHGVELGLGVDTVGRRDVGRIVGLVAGISDGLDLGDVGVTVPVGIQPFDLLDRFRVSSV